MDGMSDDAVNLTPRETDILAARLIAKHIVNDSPAVVLWEDVPELSEQAFNLLSEAIAKAGKRMLQSNTATHPDASEIERRARD